MKSFRSFVTLRPLLDSSAEFIKLPRRVQSINERVIRYSREKHNSEDCIKQLNKQKENLEGLYIGTQITLDYLSRQRILQFVAPQSILSSHRKEKPA